MTSVAKWYNGMSIHNEPCKIGKTLSQLYRLRMNVCKISRNFANFILQISKRLFLVSKCSSNGFYSSCLIWGITAPRARGGNLVNCSAKAEKKLKVILKSIILLPCSISLKYVGISGRRWRCHFWPCIYRDSKFLKFSPSGPTTRAVHGAPWSAVPTHI